MRANLLLREYGSCTAAAGSGGTIRDGEAWLDKTHAPFAIFKNSSIRALGGGRYVANGVLSIRNTERQIAVQFTGTDQANGKTVIDGDFVIKRSEFGIGSGIWNQPGVVAEEIPLKLRLALAPAGNMPGQH